MAGWSVEINHLRLAAKKAADLSTPDTQIEVVIKTDSVMVRGERRWPSGKLYAYAHQVDWTDAALAMIPVLVTAVERVAEKLREAK